MLKDKVNELLNRYESGDEWLSAEDVLEELEEIMDEEPYDEDLSPKLCEAINHYVLQRHEAEHGGGRIPDGSNEFIEELKQICEGIASPKEDLKVTLQAEELRVVLTAASLGLSIASQDDPEMVKMTQRGQAILHKICEIIDSNNKTFDLIAR